VFANNSSTALPFVNARGLNAPALNRVDRTIPSGNGFKPI
jgi:hypothetical protein